MAIHQIERLLRLGEANMDVMGYVSRKYIEYPLVTYGQVANAIGSIESDNRIGNITDKQATAYIDGLFALLNEIYSMPSSYFEGQAFDPKIKIQELGIYTPYFQQWVTPQDTAGRNDFTINGTTITFIDDGLNEGEEIATFGFNFYYPYAPRSFEIQGKTITIKDAVKKTPVITNETHSISVIVDKGVLGQDALLLKGLIEKTILTDSVITSQKIEYAGNTFEYSKIDSLITTVTRDGEFTAEFRKELTDAAPSTANLTYKDAVTLVGVLNIDSILINLAGLDGNFVN